MADLIYYCTYIITVGLIVAMFVIARLAIKRGGDSAVCSNRFAAAAVATGLVSGILILYGVLWLLDTSDYHVNVGHGEALIAVPLLNFGLGLAGAMIGKMLLTWRRIEW